jgi:hypothetical protein
MKKSILSILLIVLAAVAITPVAYMALAHWSTPVREDMKDKVAFRGKLLRNWSEELKSSDVGVRRETAAALMEIPPKDGQYLIGSLSKALNDGDNLTRCRAGIALGHIMSGASIPAPLNSIMKPDPLLEALNDPDPNVRIAAAQALASFGSRLSVAVPALTQMAKNDKDEEVRKAAAGAVEKIQPASAASETKDKGAKTKSSTDKDAKDGNAKKTASANHPGAGPANPDGKSSAQ